MSEIKGKSALLTGAGILGVALLLLGSISDFTIHLDQMMRKKTDLSLAEASAQYTAIFENRIQRQLSILEVAARNIELNGGITADSAKQAAETAQDDVYFDVVYIIDAQGVGHYQEITFSVTDKLFFQQAMQGHNAVSLPIVSKLTQENTLVLAVPVRKKDAVEGVLFGCYNLDRPGALALNTAFENSGCGFVTTKDGIVVLKSDTAKQFWEGDNLWELFHRSKLIEYSQEELEQSLVTKQSGNFAFLYQGQKNYAHFRKTALDGWYTFVLSTPKMIAEETKEFTTLVLLLGFRIFSTCMLVLLLVLWQRRQHNRKMQDAAQRIDQDTRQIQSQQRELSLGEKRFQLAIGLSGGSIFEYDVNHRRYNYFENTEQLLGCSSVALLAWLARQPDSICDRRFPHALHSIYYKDDWETVDEAYRRLYQDGRAEYQARLVRLDGNTVWCAVNLLLMHSEDKKPLYIFGHLSDINDIKRSNEQLQYQASIDPMTGLLNKLAVKEAINRSLSEDVTASGALLMLDIDNFKGVNDTLGHIFGDSVLIEAAGKLQKVMKKSDILGRIGGDEFVAYLPAVGSREEVVLAADRVCSAFHLNYTGEHNDYKISCSVGIAFTDKDSCHDYDVLYACADAALYYAKAAGKDCYHVYTGEESAMHSAVGQQSAIELQAAGRMVSIRERIFELLYGAVDFVGGVNMVLSMLGQYYDAQRAYIFENTRDNRFTRNTYEWYGEGASSQILLLGRKPLTDGENYHYLNNFDSRGVFFCDDIAKLDAMTTNQLTEAGVRSLLQVAIMEDNHIRGFVGIDDCLSNRVFTSEEIETMVHVAKIIGVFVLRKRNNDEAYFANRDKVEALDRLPVSSYVIDGDFRLMYLNNATRDYIPNARVGDFCYEAIMRNDAPCNNCPVLGCAEEPCKRRIYNPIIGRDFLSTASHVNWSGMEDSTLICCQDITDTQEAIDETTVHSIN
ncbi:MAG: diguanylate cyclase [Angelakisella sp.]